MLLMFRYRGDAIEERRVSRAVQTDPVELLVRYFSCKCASQLIGFLEHTLTSLPLPQIKFSRTWATSQDLLVTLAINGG